MPSDDATSIGTWISPTNDPQEFGTEDLEEFETVMKRRCDGSYSRSEHIRDAMALYLEVCKAVDQFGPPKAKGMDGVDLQGLVRQALLDTFRED